MVSDQYSLPYLTKYPSKVFFYSLCMCVKVSKYPQEERDQESDSHVSVVLTTGGSAGVRVSM